MNIGMLTLDSLIIVTIAVFIEYIIFSYKGYSEKKKTKLAFGIIIGLIFAFFSYRYTHIIFIIVFYMAVIVIILYFLFLLFAIHVNSKYKIRFPIPKIRGGYLSFIIILFIIAILNKIH